MFSTDEVDEFYSLEMGPTTVTYLPEEGSPKEIDILIDYGSGNEERGSDGFNVTAIARIRSYGDDGIEVVKRGETVQFNDETWKVLHARKEIDGLEWSVEIGKVL